jgi:hypothetical protein
VADLFFVFVFDGVMIRQLDQIDRDAASPLAHTLGHQPSQQVIELIFKGVC